MIHGLGGQLRNFTNSLLDRLTDEFRGTVNLTLLLARPGVSVRSGPRIFNRVDRRGLAENNRIRPLLSSVDGALQRGSLYPIPGLDVVIGLSLASHLTEHELHEPSSVLRDRSSHASGLGHAPISEAV
jgi:hypothetical protein